MEQYISKSALVAEIEKRRESNAKERYFGRLVEDNYFLEYIDTLEVKEVNETAIPVSHSLTEEGLLTFKDGSQGIITKIG